MVFLAICDWNRIGAFQQIDIWWSMIEWSTYLVMEITLGGDFVYMSPSHMILLGSWGERELVSLGLPLSFTGFGHECYLNPLKNIWWLNGGGSEVSWEIEPFLLRLIFCRRMASFRLFSTCRSTALDFMMCIKFDIESWYIDPYTNTETTPPSQRVLIFKCFLFSY